MPAASWGDEVFCWVWLWAGCKMWEKGSFSEQVVDKPPQALGHPWLVAPTEIALFHRTAQRCAGNSCLPLRKGSRAVYGHCCSLSEPNPAGGAFPFYLWEQKSIDDSSCEMPGHTLCHMAALAQGILCSICVWAAEQPCWVPLRARNEIQCLQESERSLCLKPPQDLNPLLSWIPQWVHMREMTDSLRGLSPRGIYNMVALQLSVINPFSVHGWL